MPQTPHRCPQVGSSGQGTMQVTKGLLQNLGTFSCPLSMVTPSYPLTRGLDYSKYAPGTASPVAPAARSLGDHRKRGEIVPLVTRAV